MRRFSVMVCVTNALLVFCMTFGALLCVLTAFDVPCAFDTLALFCAGAAVCFCLAFSLCRTWLVLLIAAPLAGLALWQLWMPITQALALTANTIAPAFINAFSLEQDYILLPQLQQGESGLYFFCALALLLTTLLSWAVTAAQSPSLCAVTTLPFLILCLIILQTVPAAAAVLLLVGALILLVLTQQIREREAVQGARLTLVLSAPLAALFTLLLLLSPPESYQRAKWPDSLRARINETVDALSFLRENEQTGQMEFVSPFTPSTLGAFSWDSSVKSVDLSRLGPMRKTGRSVMQVKSESGGAVYLRANSMARYEDSMWRALDADAYVSDAIAEDTYLSGAMSYAQLIEVKTNMKSSVLYLPYYAMWLPENTALHGDAYVENTLQATEYVISCAQSGAYGRNSSSFAYQHYLAVPEETEQAIKQYLARFSVGISAELPDDTEWLTRFIPEILSEKNYDLATPRAPAGEDFVSWFLLESETGYCVHFATAATMLLRYCGIPARYVTGYLAQTTPGEWTQVSEDDAHAWVEYYLDGTGWKQLEVTPPDHGSAAEKPEEPNERPDTDETNETENGDLSTENRYNSNISDKNHTSAQQPDGDTVPALTPVTDEQTGAPANGNAGKQQGSGIFSSPLLHGLWCVLALAALWFLYRIFVLSARRAQFTTGSCNKRAVLLYRHIVRLAKLADAQIPEELTALAERARFSNHQLREDALAPLTAEAARLTDLLRQTRNPLRRFVYRMIDVIW